jgi:hypothetical protein
MYLLVPAPRFTTKSASAISLEGGKWAECDPINPIEMYTQHILKNPEFFQSLFGLVAERDHGSWFEA